jgi:diadenosine tetraphosphate (Ap4A) HIT family hydrolase
MPRDATNACCDIWTKFGHPAGEILRTEHWRVVIRRKQVTLGALVLISARHVEALPALTPAEAAELPTVTRALEIVLRAAFSPDRINYLALMMVDPHLHFHVLPRYETPRTLAGHTFTDTAWGGPPRLDVPGPGDDVVAAVQARLEAAAAAGTPPVPRAR